MTTSENETPEDDVVVTEPPAVVTEVTDAGGPDADAVQPDGDSGPETRVDVESDVEIAVAPAGLSRTARRRRTLLGATLGLLLGSAVAAGSVYWFLFRPDQMTNPAAQQQVIAAAKEGIEAALSYSPENLDNDLATAKSHMTGQFLDYYSDFTKNVVTPAAKDKGVKTEANAARAAVSEMHPDKADVLVFVNQVTTSKARPTPALATSTVLVTMVKSGDRWLISEFNPV